MLIMEDRAMVETLTILDQEQHAAEGLERFAGLSNSDETPVTKTGSPQPSIPIKISSKSYALGIWLFTPNNGGSATIDSVYREGFISLINLMGYFKRYRADNTFQYIHVENNIIRAVEVSQIRDAMTDFVQNSEVINFEHSSLTFSATIEVQKEKFLRNSPSLFNDAILSHLPNHDKPILHDSETEMYFPFENCVVKVTSEDVFLMAYSEMVNVCIWQDHIINRSFSYAPDFRKAKFADFIKNVATNFDKDDDQKDRLIAFYSAIGYLLHSYSSPSTARAVIAYDEQVASKREPAGGTGKGIFVQALSQLRNTAIIDGKKIRDDSQFAYQMVTERSQIISFDDVKSDFDFLMLNSNLTTGWQIEHKNKPSFRFAPTENPKTYITSNTILKGEGTTASRRQFILEFSPFYSKLVLANLEPIVHTHGSMFFTDGWDQNEWNRFYTFMLDCGKGYLQQGLQFYNPRSIAENKLVQTTSDDFSEWIQCQFITVDKEFSLSEWYDEFRGQYYGEDRDFKQRTFTNWLKTYALTKDWKLETRRSNSKTTGKFIIKK